MRLLFLLCAISFFAGCASLPASYVELDNQMQLNLDAVLDKIAEKQVIFIGEIHGTSGIHLLQTEVIKHLKQSGKEVVVALEAFPFTRQEILNQWIGGTLSKYDFQRAYKTTWSIPFHYYESIFDYAREQQIPLLAINAEDMMIRDVSRKGLGAVPEDFLRKLGYTPCSTDAEYAALVNNTPHASEFPLFCDAERLRDSVMASTIAQAIRGQNKTVIVLAGVAHAVKPAVPRLLKNHGEVSCSVLLPQEVSYFIRKTPDRNIADFIWYK
jgi:uncharacterized iron-regulated protein